MPSYVITEKCDGCKGQDKTACMYICPNDLMVLNRDIMKAHNQEPDQCWECQCCVKICPQKAIDVRGYADFIPLGASVIPLPHQLKALRRAVSQDRVRFLLADEVDLGDARNPQELAAHAVAEGLELAIAEAVAGERVAVNRGVERRAGRRVLAEGFLFGRHEKPRAPGGHLLDFGDGNLDDLT